MGIMMKNPKTGEAKAVKVGWSWILFLFSGFLGIPLFLRKLYIWGGVFLVLWVVNLLAPSIAGDQQEALGLKIGLSIIFIGLQIYMGIKGNEMTAKNYLENGWEFTEPDSEVTKMAKAKWGINI